MKPKIVKSFRQGGSLVSTIPSSFADYCKIKSGDYLKIRVNRKRQIIIEKNE